MRRGAPASCKRMAATQAPLEGGGAIHSCVPHTCPCTRHSKQQQGREHLAMSPCWGLTMLKRMARQPCCMLHAILAAESARTEVLETGRLYRAPVPAEADHRGTGRGRRCASICWGR